MSIAKIAQPLFSVGSRTGVRITHLPTGLIAVARPKMSRALKIAFWILFAALAAPTLFYVVLTIYLFTPLP